MALRGPGGHKHVATEADRLAIALLATPYEAGLYAFATHYGSLVARLVLAPGEDACRLALAKCASHDRAASIGGLFAKGSLYVGLVCAAVGAPFGAAAARILKGNAPESDIAACGAALAYFCLQVPFLSLNGVCEACAHARADAGALAVVGRARRLRGALRSVRAAGLATTGPPGLVAAGGAVSWPSERSSHCIWRGRARFRSTAARS